jgi:RNA polymerase sigma-70 factor (ECF subfamily)
LDESTTSNGPTPEEIMQNGETSQTVHQAIRALKSEYQSVIILKHFQGLSYQEISETLEIPEKTVKSRLFSARQLLKDILIKQL